MRSRVTAPYAGSDREIDELEGVLVRPAEIVVELRSAAYGYAAVVALHGEHDLATSSELALVLSSVSGSVLVDLSACLFIDCTVIRVLLDETRSRARDGHRLALVVPPTNGPVRRVAEIIGLPALIPIVERTAIAAALSPD